MSTAKREFWRSRWWMPGVSVACGALMLAAFWAGGHVVTGIASFGVMAAFAAIVFFAKGDLIRGLSGPGRDERWGKIDVHATAISGMATTLIVIGAWLVEIGRGHDGNPYGLIAVPGGLAYIAAIAILRRRS